MHLTIFGSTGRTGQHLVAQALERGHTVTAAARTPEKLTRTHDALRVAACDVLQPETLGAAVEGADAVIVSLTGPGQTRSDGTANILAAMAAHGVDRVLIVSTAGVGDSIDQLGTFGKVFVRTVIHKAVADHTLQEQRVQGSGTRWTIARPGGLTDDPLSGRYAADPDGKIQIGRVARADVAHFLLGAAEDPTTEGRIYALSS